MIPPHLDPVFVDDAILPRPAAEAGLESSSIRLPTARECRSLSKWRVDRLMNRCGWGLRWASVFVFTQRIVAAGNRSGGAAARPQRSPASPAVNNFFTAKVTKVRRGLGVGRLARLWKFFAISAPPREIMNHADA